MPTLQTKLEALHKQLQKLHKMEIFADSTQPVFGVGNTSSKFVFIGEAPGKQEDLHGKPFIGRSGKLLDQLLESIQLAREQIYITNIVKFRPANNRDPNKQEKQLCTPILKQELQLLAPEVIISLGRHALGHFAPSLKISDVHGKLLTIETAWNPSQKLLPLYHPAAALYNPNNKQILFDDIKVLAEL